MHNESEAKVGNSSFLVSADLQATSAFAVTASDSTTFEPSVLYIGTEGNLNVTTVDGQTVLFSNIQAGFFPVLVTKVMSTSTTATNIVRLN